LPEASSPSSAISDLEIILDAVREAGAIARKYFDGNFEKWDKGEDDPVTEADLAIDAFLKQKLGDARPSYGWLSEETQDDPTRLGKNDVWVVDPIDGTRAFIKGRPHFTICVASVKDGIPQASAVYNPITDDLYRAVDGGGAFVNDTPLRVSATPTLDGCKMLGYGNMFKHPAWPRKWPEMDIENRNSVAYRMVLVAAGDFDATLALNWKSEWDLAAADLIVREAGGLCTTYQGDRFTYNNKDTKRRSVVAAGPAIHEEMMDRMAHLTLP